jgi:mono/diheme cytochrome c family protein
MGEPMRLLFVGVAVLLFGTGAQAQDPAARGRAIARQNCASCHAIGKTGDSPHKGAPPFRTLGRSYNLDEINVMLQRGISDSHPDMPAFKFKPVDARALRAYLRSIAE